jgi:hypothetical protein
MRTLRGLSMAAAGAIAFTATPALAAGMSPTLAVQPAFPWACSR